MPIPTYQQMMLPMLRLIGEGHAQMKECMPHLMTEFAVSKEEAEVLLPSGKQTMMSNRAHWARQYLSQAGLVEATKRGHYQISSLGRGLLAEKHEEISVALLKKFPKFQEFMDKSSKSAEPASGETLAAPVPEGEETPDDLIAQAHAQIEQKLAADLLTAVQTMTPTQFEQLIVDLLLAMGYGGGDRSMGERIGKSGDGGIDGIINEDALGLDAVYIQAKRYAPDSKVGRPALQAFVGSLTGEGANKGVFVTTSDFSKDAKDYLNKVQHRIVLINGETLARLMIRHEVGVRARRTYVVRSVDEDYFIEADGD
jgi:restriction system protein